MKRILIQLLLMAVAVNCAQALNLQNDSYTLAYAIHLNNAEKGLLLIDREPKAFASKYYNVSKSDKLPFYYATKAGTYEKGVYSTRLDFGKRSFLIYNNRKSMPANLVENLDGEAKNRSVMVDSTLPDLPRLTFDRIPMTVFENIILGFVTRQVPIDKDMLLYEEGSKTRLRVFLKESPDKRGKNTIFHCYRKTLPGKQPKKLFVIEVSENQVPLSLSSPSGRWSLKFLKAGHKIHKNENIENHYRDVAMERIVKKVMGSRAKSQITDTRFHDNAFRYTYQLDMPLKSYTERELAVKYFHDTFGGGSGSHFRLRPEDLTSSNGSYYVQASREEVCAALKKRVKGIDSDCTTALTKRDINPNLLKFIKKLRGSYPGINVIKTRLRFHVLVDGNGKKINLKEAAIAYMQLTYPDITGEVKIRDVKMDISEMGDTYSHVAITCDFRRRIPQKELESAAVAAIEQKLWSQASYISAQRLKEKVKPSANGYYIQVTARSLRQTLKRLQRAECEKTRALIGAESYDENSASCRYYGSGAIGTDQLRASIETHLVRRYPDLKYRIPEIRKTGNTWSFETIDTEITH